mmetsp:Transcript_32867/g.48206  ORF Transcript_32867/g.48206 Transcript_32867/m.48206 type:complete len:101 (-) Transcript_32867:92-394(-)
MRLIARSGKTNPFSFAVSLLAFTTKKKYFQEPDKSATLETIVLIDDIHILLRTMEEARRAMEVACLKKNMKLLCLADFRSIGHSPDLCPSWFTKNASQRG